MIRSLLTLCFVALLMLTVAPVKAEGAAEPHRRILVFTRSAGFQHSVVKVENGKPCFLETVLQPIAAKHNWELVVTKDGSLFTAENLAKFDAFIFYTTGDLTGPGKNADGSKPISAEGKAAFLDAIKSGKGFVGFHCATDTFNTPGDRYTANDITKIDPYLQMLGGEFIHHGAQQSSTLIIGDGKFPGAAALDGKLEATEEWYSLKNFAPDLHVILAQGTEGMKGNMYQRPPYPETWARLHGKGRVFYSSMGHRDDVWQNPKFQGLFIGAISWAVGNVEADVMPNITTVTPDAGKMPPAAAAKPKGK